MIIPSGAFSPYTVVGSNFSVLTVSGVPDSILSDVSSLFIDNNSPIFPSDILSAAFDVSLGVSNAIFYGQRIGITCTLVRDPSQRVCLAYLNTLQRRWECVDLSTTLDAANGVVTATGYTDHFSSFAVLVAGEDSETTDSTSSSSSSEGSLPVWIWMAAAAGALFVVAVSAIGVSIYYRRLNRMVESSFGSLEMKSKSSHD